MYVYLLHKFEVSSVILTSYRKWGYFTPPQPQNEPLKRPPRLGLITCFIRSYSSSSFTGSIQTESLSNEQKTRRSNIALSRKKVPQKVKWRFMTSHSIISHRLMDHQSILQFYKKFLHVSKCLSCNGEKTSDSCKVELRLKKCRIHQPHS